MNNLRLSTCGGDGGVGVVEVGRNAVRKSQHADQYKVCYSVFVESGDNILCCHVYRIWCRHRLYLFSLTKLRKIFLGLVTSFSTCVFGSLLFLILCIFQNFTYIKLRLLWSRRFWFRPRRSNQNTTKINIMWFLDFKTVANLYYELSLEATWSMHKLTNLLFSALAFGIFLWSYRNQRKHQIKIHWLKVQKNGLWRFHPMLGRSHPGGGELAMGRVLKISMKQL